MTDTSAEVHVYASGREFVVVPVGLDPVGAPVEVAPVAHVNIVLGRATLVELTRALREGMQRRAAEGGDAVWDGDNGRWWAHNLVFVILRRSEASLTFVRQELEAGGKWVAADVAILPSDTPFSDLAERVIRVLGDRLHA